MKTKAFTAITVLLTFLLVTPVLGQKAPADYVNTFIGTGAHGHTYPGATVPFGMVQLSPDTRLEGWDGCGGYHYDDEYIYGFSHTHLNGTGVPDLCDILFMPVTGECRWLNGADGERATVPISVTRTRVRHRDYYQVFLDDYRVNAELTATTRVGFHQYTFPEAEQASILVDLFHRDNVVESSLHVISDTEIEGMRRSSSWADDQYVYFVAEFSKPFESYDVAVDNVTRKNIRAIDNKKNLKAYFHFSTKAGEKILVKVGISPVGSKEPVQT
jgi:putative alpha-1,2-mannosidase